MDVLAVMLAVAGVVLAVSAALFLARDTRRLVAAGTKDPGLRGRRGLSAAALCLGVGLSLGAALLRS